MIESRLTTKMSSVSADDTLLAGRIDDALHANKFLRRTGSDGIEIIVKDGVVTLNGHVEATTHKMHADSAVRLLPGVAQLENQLVADDKLTIAVADALGNDDRMHGEQMGVNAQHGFIYLTGRAGNADLRLMAAQIAAGVPQVRGIINRIQAPGVVMDDVEEPIVQPAIDQEIYTTNDELGRVRQVIINPHSRRVSAVVANAQDAAGNTAHTARPDSLRHDEHAQHGRQVIIPIGDLRCAPSGAIFLKLSHGEIMHFLDFDRSSFVAPPVDWQPPYPYHLNDVLFSR